MTWKTSLIAAAICGSCSIPALAGSVTADPNRLEFVKTVETADLNLTSQKGKAALETRIRSAAQLVCGVGDSRDLRATRDANACFAGAMGSARAQMLVVLKKAGQDVAALEVVAR